MLCQQRQQGLPAGRALWAPESYIPSRVCASLVHVPWLVMKPTIFFQHQCCRRDLFLLLVTKVWFLLSKERTTKTSFISFTRGAFHVPLSDQVPSFEAPPCLLGESNKPSIASPTTPLQVRPLWSLLKLFTPVYTSWYFYGLFCELHLETQSSPLPSTARPASGSGYDQRDMRTVQNPALLVCMQRLDNVKEQK